MDKNELKIKLNERLSTGEGKKPSPKTPDPFSGASSDFKHKFVLVTADFSGLGFALQEINQGGEVIIALKPKCDIEPDEQESYDIQGQGFVEQFQLDDLMKKREEYRDWYWIWDGNHNYDENELLRSEGFKVGLGGEFSYKLENDREFGVEFATSCGLNPPDTFEFSSVKEGVNFLEQNEETAYVFKPDETSESWLTYVPIAEDSVNANLELREFLIAVEKSFPIKKFVLQKKVKGVEVNVEGFFQNGEVIYAHANFENKKSHQNDTGEATGCAFDVEFTLPVKSKLFGLTVGKFASKLKEMNYTGFADANVIVGEFQDVYFLEFCFRTGYNASPNLFYNLFEKTYLQTVADLIDGKFETKVKDGFGASITMFTNHHHLGLPIYVPESAMNKFYLFDGYREDGKLYMGGLSKEIGIVMAHDYSIENALRNVVDNAEKVLFPCRYARWDAHKSKDTSSGIKRRWEALMAMGMFI